MLCKGKSPILLLAALHRAQSRRNGVMVAVRADLCEMTLLQRVGQWAPSGVSWQCSPFHFPFQVNAPSTATNVELLLPRRGTCWGTSSCTLGRNRSNVPSAATPADGGTPSQDTSGPTPVSPHCLLFPLAGSFLATAKAKQVVEITVSGGSGAAPSSSDSTALSFGKALMWIRKVVVQPHLSFCVTELLCWCYHTSLWMSPWVYPDFAGRLFWHSRPQSGCEIPKIRKINLCFWKPALQFVPISSSIKCRMLTELILADLSRSFWLHFWLSYFSCKVLIPKGVGEIGLSLPAWHSFLIDFKEITVT